MERLDILVTYDVNVTSDDGQARLARVAKVCKSLAKLLASLGGFELCFSGRYFLRLHVV